MGWGYFQQKAIDCIISFLFTGVGRGGGELDSLFSRRVLFYLLCIGKKVNGFFSFLHWEYFYGPVCWFCFREKSFAFKGVFQSSRMLWTLGDYIGSGLLFSVFVCFREDTTCSFLFLVFYFGISGGSGMALILMLSGHCDWSWILLRMSTFFCHNTILFCSSLQHLFSPLIRPLSACMHASSSLSATATGAAYLCRLT